MLKAVTFVRIAKFEIPWSHNKYCKIIMNSLLKWMAPDCNHCLVTLSKPNKAKNKNTNISEGQKVNYVYKYIENFKKSQSFKNFTSVHIYSTSIMKNLSHMHVHTNCMWVTKSQIL